MDTLQVRGQPKGRSDVLRHSAEKFAEIENKSSRANRITNDDE